MSPPSGNATGRSGSQPRRRQSTEQLEDGQLTLDDSRPMIGYGCLGRRSTSMEYGLESTVVTSKKQRQAKRNDRQRRRNGGSAQSLDHLSDRVYSALSLMELSQQSTPGHPYGSNAEYPVNGNPDVVDANAPPPRRDARNVYSNKRGVYAAPVPAPRSAAPTGQGQRNNRQTPTNSAPSSTSKLPPSAAVSSRRRVENWLTSPTAVPTPPTAGVLRTSASANSLRRTDSGQSANGNGTSAARATVQKTRSNGFGTSNGVASVPTKMRTTSNDPGGVNDGIPRTWSTPFDMAACLDDDLAPSRRGGAAGNQAQVITPITETPKGRVFKQTPIDGGLNGPSPVTQVPVTSNNMRTPVTGSLVPNVRPRRNGGQKENNGTQTTGQVGGRAVLRVQQQPQLLTHDGSLVNDTRHGATYRKGKLLGKGGFAKCFEMTDIKTDTIYAGKVIAKIRLAKGNQKDKIVREVELHRNLRHKNVVCFHSYFEDDSNIYMILENCTRKSLVHVLKKRTTLTDPEVRYHMRHLVAGLRYVHGQRIIHRDLKLGNMLLSEAMELKIADFGLATRVEYEGEKKMTVCGTPNYISPEVLQKRGHSYEADIWALGCIMYALLCGRPPYETATLKETYMRIVTNKFTIPPHVLRSARDLICRLLVVNPNERPSLDDIDADAYFFDGHMPQTLDPSTCEQPPKFPVPLIAASRPRNVVFKNKETLNKEPVQSSLAQTRGGRKYASQIITRTNSPPNAEAMGSLLRDGYPHQAGSAPSIAAEVTLGDVAGLAQNSALRLYRHLVACFDTCIITDSTVTQISRPQILCITKWVDYSNKYGFGFQLSDGSIGILFNDNTRMLLNSDGNTIQYNDLSNHTHTFSAQTSTNEHHKKVTLLMYFAEYMDTHLITGGNVQPTEGFSMSSSTNALGVHLPAKDEQSTAIFMKKWFRTERAIVMYLTNGTLQVNYLDDHTKIVVNPDGPRDYLVTYVNNERHPTSYLLTALRHFGCTSGVLERLRYAGRMLERIINVDGESV